MTADEKKPVKKDELKRWRRDRTISGHFMKEPGLDKMHSPVTEICLRRKAITAAERMRS